MSFKFNMLKFTHEVYLLLWSDPKGGKWGVGGKDRICVCVCFRPCPQLSIFVKVLNNTKQMHNIHASVRVSLWSWSILFPLSMLNNSCVWTVIKLKSPGIYNTLKRSIIPELGKGIFWGYHYRRRDVCRVVVVCNKIKSLVELKLKTTRTAWKNIHKNMKIYI